MRSVFYLITLMMLITSCGDDDGGSNGGGDGFFKCTVDGTAYDIQGQYAWAELIADDLFVVYGSEDQTMAGFNNLFISFIGRPTVGTYDLSDSDIAIGTYLDTGSGETYLSALSGGSGEAEVTEITTDRVKGKFSFFAPKANDSGLLEVADGEFDVRIGF